MFCLWIQNDYHSWENSMFSYRLIPFSFSGYEWTAPCTFATVMFYSTGRAPNLLSTGVANYIFLEHGWSDFAYIVEEKAVDGAQQM